MLRPLIFLLFFYPLLAFSQATTDLGTVRGRVVEELTAEQPDSATVHRLVADQSADGTWPDLDYRDTSRTGFQHRVHLTRLVDLALAYRDPLGSHAGDPAVRRAIDLALDHWIAKDYRSANWWYNQIGVPDLLTDVLLILDEDVSAEQATAAEPIVARAWLGAWGARPGGDRIKIASIMGRRGLYYRQPDTVQAAVTAMALEIGLATDRESTPGDFRGLQTDLSFQHRSDRVTSVLSYGLGYARSFAEWAELLAGTDYQFPEERLKLLIDFYLDGIASSAPYGIYPDPGAKNRSLSRGGTLHAYGAADPRALAAATSYRHDELMDLAARREAKLNLGGTHNRFYYNSEYLAHQRPGWFASVRMYSTRNHSMEVPYNEEGLKNHYLGDGGNWLTVNGDEHLDIFPVFDFRKVPGATVVQEKPLAPSERIQQRGRTEFVGGVSDGTYGAAAFDFDSPLDSLSARKGWFFFDDGYVALGAGITSPEETEVVTTLAQRWLDGPVVVRTAEGYTTPGPGQHLYQDVRWVYHDRIGYLFPTPTTVHIVNDTASGSWYALNRQTDTPRDQVTGEVFKLWIDHGQQPVNADYTYLVLPNVDREQMSRHFSDPTLQIGANSPELQAVTNETLGITQALFYAAGTLRLADGVELEMPQPGLLMITSANGRPAKLVVEDPTRRLTELEVRLSGAFTTDTENVDLSYDTVSDRTTVTVPLPQGEYAGKSVSVDLK